MIKSKCKGDYTRLDGIIKACGNISGIKRSPATSKSTIHHNIKGSLWYLEVELVRLR